MKQKSFAILIVSLIVLITCFAVWRTSITKYKPKSSEEGKICEVFIKYITSRNNRDAETFLSTLHDDCIYMITKDLIVNKEQLKGYLPSLWMQNDNDKAAFGRCMAWECWHENHCKTVMLVNPKFRISGQHAQVDFKIVSGLFMDDNYFRLVKEKDSWLITEFMRPIY